MIDARPPFQNIALLDTGPITNHVNVARTAQGQFAYVTAGGLNFMTNSAGAAIVDAIGPLRRSVQGVAGTPRRYLVIAPSGEDKPGAPVQVQR